MREEEEEAITSNGMNNDDKANINSRSDFDNNRIGDGDNNCNLNQISQVWGTWEELVLTCAVKRHGLSDWDSVAKEVQTRSRSPSLIAASAGNCRLKYQDLKRRFQDSVDGSDGGDDGERDNEAVAAVDGTGENTWIEQLRKLRVAELRREVQRCDDSILSLQIKVKKLEEEKDGDDGDKKPDLKNNAKAVKSGSNEFEPARLNRETTESDRDNLSMNESNSTASVDKIADHERLRGDKTVQACKNTRNPDPDPVNKASTADEEEGTVSMRSGMSHSGELGESGTSTVPGKRKRKTYRSGEGSSIRGGSGNDIKLAGDKSEPLIEIIKLIRSHPRGSVFESRLRSQESKDYKRLIKQHLDIKTIEKKLKKGSYVSSSLCFYRDIKLLFTNAIVFFPPSSSESKAAHELRTLVSNEIKKRSVTNTEPESSVSKQKSSVLLPPPSLVACTKKKGSVSRKTTSPSSSSVKEKDEKKKSQEVSEEKKSVTSTSNGGRSSRKTNDVVVKDNKTGRAKNGNKKKQADTKADSSSDDEDDDEKEESSKTEKGKKKENIAVALDKNKKKSVADFLKRIKKNSPEKAKETNNQKKKSDENVKKESNGKAKPRELRSNTADKKKVEVENNSKKSSSKGKQTKDTTEATTTTGKRSRETGKEDKQPRKRNRR